MRFRNRYSVSFNKDTPCKSRYILLASFYVGCFVGWDNGIRRGPCLFMPVCGNQLYGVHCLRH